MMYKVSPSSYYYEPLYESQAWRKCQVNRTIPISQTHNKDAIRCIQSIHFAMLRSAIRLFNGQRKGRRPVRPDAAMISWNRVKHCVSLENKCAGVLGYLRSSGFALCHSSCVFAADVVEVMSWRLCGVRWRGARRDCSC